MKFEAEMERYRKRVTTKRSKRAYGGRRRADGAKWPTWIEIAWWTVLEYRRIAFNMGVARFGTLPDQFKGGTMIDMKIESFTNGFSVAVYDNQDGYCSSRSDGDEN